MFLTHLRATKYIRLSVFNHAIKFGKAYFCDKKKVAVDIPDHQEGTTTPEAKKEICTPTDENLKSKSPDQIEKEAFENEDSILQVILTEKERDASVRSRLSKEVSTLLADNKMQLTSQGLSTHFDQFDLKDVGWGSYPFHETLNIIKSHSSETSSAPVCSKAPVTAVAASAAVAAAGGGGGSGSAPASGNRIKRGEPGKVILCFIPEEWWKFFIPKTGVTGFGTFLVTFGTFLISKEYYVLEHDFYCGLSLIVLWYYAIKHVGPIMTKFLDSEIDKYEKAWNQSRTNQEKTLNQQIEDELLMQHQAEGQMMLLAAKKENVLLQLEAEFRKRQMYAYEEVKNRLDYQVALINAHRRIIHKNLVDYVTREVRKAITPELQSQMINVSIQTIIAEFEKK